MNEDGTMARMPDLVAFAQRYGLKIGTIADLIAYRLRHDRLVKRIVETPFESRHGGAFQMVIYENTVAYAEHIALVKGDVTDGTPVPVRMHAMNVLDDVLGDATSENAGVLQRAMTLIGEMERGVVVLIREPLPTRLSDRVKKKAGLPTSSTGELRDYGVGAQILRDLGIAEMKLISNRHRTIIGLEGYGLSVVEQIPVPE